jgi:catechol-2,3-dioxygenase
MELRAFHHVALTVRDCDASARWYGEVLGFRELFGEDGPQRRARILAIPGGGISVGLVEHVGEHDAFDPTRTGLDHLAFSVETPEALDTWALRLDAAGIENSGILDAGPSVVLNFKDPDGIALALFWDVP